MVARPITPDDFPWFDYSRYSFSLGLEVAGQAFLSGHSASRFDPEQSKMVVEGGMADQARVAYSKIETILAAAGLSLSQVTRVVENVTVAGMDQYPEAEAVRAEVFGPQCPAVNTIVVHSLLRPDALIEIEATAGGEGQSYAVSGQGRASFAPAHSADGVVYLSTVYPYDDDGGLVGRGDAVAQVRQIFDNASRVLEAAGLSMRNVVKTLEMISPAAVADYKLTGAARREYLGPVYPAAAGIIQDRVAADEEVLVSYDFIASTHKSEAVNPGWDRYDKLTYSPAVRAGNTLFMSGHGALDQHTGQVVHAGDVVAQTDYVYRKILTLAEESGLGPSNIIKTIEFVTPAGLPDYRETAAVRKNLLMDPYPASTGVVCHSLLKSDLMIEIVATAVDEG